MLSGRRSRVGNENALPIAGSSPVGAPCTAMRIFAQMTREFVNRQGIMRLVNVIAITIVWLVRVGAVEAATLSWDRNPEASVTGYVVSYGTQPGVHTTSVDVGNVITYVLNPPSGQRYYIVVQAYNQVGRGPKSAEVVLDLSSTNQSPTLNQPPNQSGFVGDPATLALSGTDPENAALTYSATGLPPGLAINPPTGVISGTLQTEGTYGVTATVSDGSLTASRSFTWVVATQTSPPLPPGSSDTTPPTVGFMSPTNNATLNGKNVKVRATASDNTGVRSVRYLLNGLAISSDITNAPYTYTWDLSRVTAGSYQLTARAVDHAGNQGTSTITVTVRAGGNGKNSVETATTSEIPADGDAPPTPLDTSVSGDFDGDGLSDPGAYTAATGEWRLWLSSIRYRPAAPMFWGMQDDVPVPADYDGDGRTDLAVFRPSTGTWSIVASNNGTPSRLEIPWGRFGDSPMPFDYDHDGRADLALRRSGGFDVLLSSSNYMTSVTVR